MDLKRASPSSAQPMTPHTPNTCSSHHFFDIHAMFPTPGPRSPWSPAGVDQPHNAADAARLCSNNSFARMLHTLPTLNVENVFQYIWSFMRNIQGVAGVIHVRGRKQSATQISELGGFDDKRGFGLGGPCVPSGS